MPYPSHPPAVYVDPSIFQRERTTLFSDQWMFAGMADELPEHNDFVRVRLVGHDVVIQNFHGELHAFINSCSHRHSLIQTAPSGNRPLVCPYHGWAYDKRGAPVGVPAKKEFPQVTADPTAYLLQRVALEQAGHFMFVRLNPGIDEAPPTQQSQLESLRGFLGEAFDFLTNVSSALGVKLDDYSATVTANWKIVIENSLEGYHVPHVHRNSLGAISQLSVEETDVEDFYPASGHNYMHNAASAKWLKRWSTYAADVGTWPLTFPHYVHRLIFPMLTITSFLGYSFHIQRFHPDAVDSTTVRSRIYASSFTGQTQRGSRIMEAIFRENVHFTHLVFDEDKVAAEHAHEGSKQATRPSLLAMNMEQRLADFRATWHRALGPLAEPHTGESR